MQELKTVNPFRCKMWELHDRLESSLTEETCRAEIESISRKGQLVPALARALHNDPGHDYELIYGARRLFVARHLNKPLLVEIRDISDREAIIAMDIENRQRKDISPYERGLSYANWLRSGQFSSQDELARELRISASQVSRLLRVARLPAVIVSAFGNPTAIREVWGVELSEALEDPHRRQVTIGAARATSAQERRPAPEQVFCQLIAAGAPGRKVRNAAHDEVVVGDDGRPLFRIRRQRSSIALLLPIAKVSRETLDHIRLAIIEVCVNK